MILGYTLVNKIIILARGITGCAIILEETWIYRKYKFYRIYSDTSVNMGKQDIHVYMYRVYTDTINGNHG